MGDINAHNTLWENNSKEDSRGKRIAELITRSNMIILNDGEHAWMGPKGKSSAIDITLGSPSIAIKTKWKVDITKVGNSDHHPIRINIKDFKIGNLEEKIKIDYKKTLAQIEETNLTEIRDIEAYEKIISDIIKNNSIKITKNNKYIPKKWWSEKIERLWEVKRAKLKIYNQSRNNRYAEIELKKATSRLRMEIRMEKRKSWNEYISEINPTMKTKEIWRRIRSMDKGSNESNNTFNNIKSMEKFMETSITESTTHKANELKFRMEPIASEEFETKEIESIIKRSKNTTPGMNNISYKLLKKLPITHIEKITELINDMWKMQNYPESWKVIKIVPIPKQNKDVKKEENYRGIHMYQTIAKITSKLIKKRLNEFINKQKLLPEASYGFRQERSTIDYINELVGRLEKKKNNKSTVVIVTDVEKAFDRVDINKLINIMRNHNIPERYNKWIYNSLINRKVIMEMGGKQIEKITSSSIPQGEPLSPDLFNLYTSNLHKISNEKIMILQYADDFLIIVEGENWRETERTAQKAINKFNEELKKLHLNINPHKTTYTKFKGKDKNQPISIKIDNNEIKETTEIKILGYTVDNKMNFNKHYRILKNKCMTAINIMKSVARKGGGAHPSTLLNLHKSLLESRVRYSASIPMKDKNKKIIQTLINTSLRICLGLTNSTPVTAVIAEAGDLPIENKIKLYNYNYVANKIAQNNEIGRKIKNSESSSTLNKLYEEYKNMLDKTLTRKQDGAENEEGIRIDTKLHKKIGNIKSHNITQLRIVALEHMDKYRGKSISFTDGSIYQDRRGIGIYNEYSKETYSYRLLEEVSIKTLETIAIKHAMDIAIKNGIKEIVIMTDSMSACLALDNEENKKKKYLEQKIKNKIKKHKLNVTISWIPSHVGIKGNEEADMAAKKGTESNRIMETRIPVTENNNIFKKKMYTEWREEFNRRTTTKGTQHKMNIAGKVLDKPWFHKRKLKSAEMIKKITRIRTGHTYDKKYLKLVKKIENEKCETCDKLEDARHIIEECRRHDVTRAKYKRIKNKELQQILNEGDLNEYEELNKFLTETKMFI